MASYKYVIVAGSDNASGPKDEAMIHGALARHLRGCVASGTKMVLIHGGERITQGKYKHHYRGVDAMADRWAYSNLVQRVIIPNPQPPLYPRSAGKRNAVAAEFLSHVVRQLDGDVAVDMFVGSSGARFDLRLHAKNFGVQPTVYILKEGE